MQSSASILWADRTDFITNKRLRKINADAYVSEMSWLGFVHAKQAC